MKEQQIDELFIDKLGKNQSFYQSERQWKVVKAAIGTSRRRYLLWILIPVLIFGTSALSIIYLGADAKQPLAVVVTSDKNSATTGKVTSVPKVVASTSPIKNTSPGDYSSVSTVSNTHEKTDGAAINNVVEYSTISQLGTKSRSSVNSNVENQSSYFGNNSYRKVTSSKIVSIETVEKEQYSNSPNEKYGSKSLSYYPDLQKNLIYHNNIARLDIVAVTSDAKNLLVKVIEVPQHFEQVLSRKKFMIFAGPSYSFTLNPDLQLIKPAAFKLGVAYTPIKLLTLRMAYQYDPFDIQINSNFEKYNIEPQGSYEPQFREKLNVRGQSHVLALGLAANMRVRRWGFYPMLHANIQYLNNTVEENTFITNYERVVSIDNIVNQSSLSTFSGGLGLQYNLRHTAFSLEYEYYMPFNSLYEWTGVQTTSFLVQYKF